MRKRLSKAVVLVGIAVAVWVGSATAGTDIGDVCIGFTGVPDTIQMSANITSGPEPLVDLHFRWRGTNYQILGSGTATVNPVDPAKVDIGLVGTQSTAQFGGNPQCSLYATITIATGKGAFAMNCTGSGGAPFTATGNLSIVTCN